MKLFCNFIVYQLYFLDKVIIKEIRIGYELFKKKKKNCVMKKCFFFMFYKILIPFLFFLGQVLIPFLLMAILMWR